jgi:hypothetical protein
MPLASLSGVATWHEKFRIEACAGIASRGELVPIAAFRGRQVTLLVLVAIPQKELDPLVASAP